MEYNNYDQMNGRRHSTNQTPYSRDQDNNAIMGRPMVSVHGRRVRGNNNSGRYDNSNEVQEASLANVSAGAQTPRPSFNRPQFQTPFAVRRDPPSIPAPRTPFSDGMNYSNSMMLPQGSPATPKPFGQYSSASNTVRYPPMMHEENYDAFGEQYRDDTTMQAVPHEYERPTMQSDPQDYNMSYGGRKYAGALRGAMNYGNDTPYEQQYRNSVRHFPKSEPMHVDPVKFSNMSLNQSAAMSVGQGAKQAVAPPTSSFVMTKKAETKEEDVKAAHEPTAPTDLKRVFSGPIDKVVNWSSLLKGKDASYLYEVIGSLVSVRVGNVAGEQTIIIRDKSTPVLQCLFQETDRSIPILQPGQLVRCVGKIVGKGKMRAFSVRVATATEKSCQQRFQFICNRVANDIATAPEPNNVGA